MALSVRHLGAAMRRGAAVRQSLAILPKRSGMGLPIGRPPPITEPLPEEADLIWDYGSPYPEHINSSPGVDPYEALKFLGLGMSFFAMLGVAAALVDVKRKRPYPLKKLPWLELDEYLTPPGGYRDEVDHLSYFFPSLK